MKRPQDDEVWYSRSRHSDLDWALHSSSSRTYQHRKPPGWQCGNRKRLRHVFSEFTKYSSMHGVHYICSNDHRSSKLIKIVYRILFTACLVLMLASVTFLMQESFSTESVYVSSTSKEGDNGVIEDHFFPQYPRITICRSPGYATGENSSLQEMMEYTFIGLGYHFASLTPREQGFLVQFARDLKKNKTLDSELKEFSYRLQRLQVRYDKLKTSEQDFNITQFILEHSVKCEDIFLRCIALYFPLKCCSLFRPVLTSLGNCYYMELSEQMLGFQKTARDIGFSFIFDLQEVPDPGKEMARAYLLYLSDPRDKEVLFQPTGHTVMNGFETLMKTSLIKTSRTALYTPWHGLSTVCPTMAPHLDTEYGTRFFKAACNKLYLERKIREACHCRLITDPRNASMRHCDPVDIYGCFVYAALKDNLTGMGTECPLPCIEYNYKSEVNFVRIGGNNCRLVLQYDGEQYDLHEYRTTTISSFLSQIGGALGLYLGASIITAFELITFLASWLWYRFLPNRRVTNAGPSSFSHQKIATDKQLYFY